MENTNEQEIKIGDYVKLKSDPDQIFIIAEIVDEYTISAIDKNKNRYPLNISDIEIGDYADMLKYEKYPPLFYVPKTFRTATCTPNSSFHSILNLEDGQYRGAINFTKVSSLKNPPLFPH